MKIIRGVRVYEGPRLAGPEGRRVRALALPVVVDTGALAVATSAAGRDPYAAQTEIAARLGMHPSSERAALATLEGWTIDGRPWSRAEREALDLDDEEGFWLAVLEVWADAGFFGSTLQEGFRAAAAAEG